MFLLNLKYTRLFCSVVFLIYLSHSNAQNIAKAFSQNGIEKYVDSLVLSKVASYNIPGIAIGIVSNDSVVLTKGYGKKHHLKKGVINAKTNFHTASVSKLFTAQAIVDLVYENKLAMQDKLVDLIPNLKYSDNRVSQITLLSLLNHSSGLGDIKNYKWYKNNHSDQALANYFLTKKLNLKYPPHTTYHYSNLGYNLLGRIIEKVTGKTFEDYLKEKVLSPCGMLQSDFRYFNIADSIKSTPHRLSFLFKKIKERKIYPYTREHAASSTLNSSVSDLSQWMLHFLNQINLESGLYKKMFHPSFEPYPYIGLGYQLGKLNGFDVAGHLGGDKGFRSYLLLVPKLKMGVVLLANCDYNEDFRQEIVHPIVKKMMRFNSL